MCIATPILGFGEPPDFGPKEEEKQVGQLEKIPELEIPNNESGEVVSANAISADDNEVIFDQRKKVAQFIKLKQFMLAKNALEKIPPTARKDEEKAMLVKLELFESIEKDNQENSKLFKRGSGLSKDTENQVKRLYKGGQSTYLENRTDLSKDLLVQALNFDRRHYKSKQLLERGLGLGVGDYTVENVEAKYWKMSLVNMYSGYPEKAVKDLKVLEYFDPENPLIFERMGSAYYSMGETRSAVQAWKRALYLDPKNKDLEEFISNAEEEIKRQDKMARELSKKKDTKKESTADTSDMQLLRVVSDANVAYSYAQEVREQTGGEVVVEEMDNGKWAIKIPKPKAKK